MQIKAQINNDTTVVTLSGEVDLSNSPILRKKLLESINTNILVDLSDVSYMDSSGLATLIEAMQKVNKNGRTFKLTGVKGAVKNILEIARLTEVFSIQ